MYGINTSFSSIFAFIFILPVACYGGEKFQSPERSPEEIISRSQALISNRKIISDNYDLNSLSYDYIKGNWTVIYIGKSLGIGDEFMIIVDDNDMDKTEFVPGL